ncbi:MAG: YdiU family protein [Gemmatimonadota bacterium]
MTNSDSFAFDNSYAAEMEGFYVPWQGSPAPDPRVVVLNEPLARELSLDVEGLASPEGAAVLAGSRAPQGAAPLAQVYAGHQFGGFSPQLGDGRALLVGEIIDRHGARRDLHLKGSGPTPFARGGDGKAVLGPVLREYLMGEAMHALGVPTTRALAAVTTGERIVRNGPEPGAVLARVAASHLRVGTFQFFAARGEMDKVRQLADYALRRHFPRWVDAPDRYLRLFREVRDRQAALVARWMSIGFVHGVMNTDNMAISGETIDYGPCAFMDAYGPGTVFSSIDHHGRSAYGNQPRIAQWNLARFAETLLPLIAPDDVEGAIPGVTAEVEAFMPRYQARWLEAMTAKLGLDAPRDGDRELVDDLLSAMDLHDVDFTSLFRRLADAARGAPEGVRALFGDTPEFDRWLERWRVRLEQEEGGPSERAEAMDRVNPVYIPRNHKVQAALDAATASDLEPFRRLLEVLRRPFERRPGLEAYEGPAPPDFGPYRTFCGT